MLRLILQEFGLFLLPFLAFAAYLLFARKSPLDRAHWAPHWTRLILAGLGVVVVSLVVTGLATERHPDGYVPPRIENGKLVPGHFQEGGSQK